MRCKSLHTSWSSLGTAAGEPDSHRILSAGIGRHKTAGNRHTAAEEPGSHILAVAGIHHHIRAAEPAAPAAPASEAAVSWGAGF